MKTQILTIMAISIIGTCGCQSINKTKLNSSIENTITQNDIKSSSVVLYDNQDKTIIYSYSNLPENEIELVSLIKPIIIDEAIKQGIVKWDTIIDCGNGYEEFDDVAIRDVKRYGKQTVKQILLNQSNIGTVKIAKKLGNVAIAQRLKSLGVTHDFMDNPKNILEYKE